MKKNLFQLTTEDISTFSKERDEPEWLLKIRLESFSKLQKEAGKLITGQEKAILEDFDIGSFLKNHNQNNEGKGRLNSFESLFGNLLGKQGIVFKRTEKAIKEDPALVREALTTSWDRDIREQNPFLWLNKVFWTTGYFLYIPPELEVEEPIQSFFTQSSNYDIFQRNFIIVDQYSKADFMEGCSSVRYKGDTQGFRSPFLDIILKDGASLSYAALQNWGGVTGSLGHKRVSLSQKSKLDWVDCQYNPTFLTNDPVIDISGEGCDIKWRTVIAINLGHKIKSGIKLNIADQVSSSLDLGIRGLLKNGSSIEFIDEVVASEKAAKALNLDLSSLKMDDESEAIFESLNPVEGRTVLNSSLASLNQDYLRMRGFSEKSSQAILSESFIFDIVDKMPMEYGVELSHLIRNI